MYRTLVLILPDRLHLILKRSHHGSGRSSPTARRHPSAGGVELRELSAEGRRDVQSRNLRGRRAGYDAVATPSPTDACRRKAVMMHRLPRRHQPLRRADCDGRGWADLGAEGCEDSRAGIAPAGPGASTPASSRCPWSIPAVPTTTAASPWVAAPEALVKAMVNADRADLVHHVTAHVPGPTETSWRSWRPKTVGPGTSASRAGAHQPGGRGLARCMGTVPSKGRCRMGWVSG